MCFTANKFNLDVDSIAVLCHAKHIAERHQGGGEDTDIERLGDNCPIYWAPFTKLMDSFSSYLWERCKISKAGTKMRTFCLSQILKKHSTELQPKL
jgi:hypothetical protein